uniref:C1q domain-containing protein n=1 Tax=Magallana gigas TaxID=29159 RepID=A0A8W8JD15_MAGGI
MYRNQDLKLAIQKIDELQKIVRAQDDRISTLEKRHKEESKVQVVTDLQNLVKKQNNRIAQLETRIKELETVKKAEEYVPVGTKGYTSISKMENISANSTENYTRKGRLLSIQPTTVPVDMVAFYAYLSSDTPAAVPHHIFKFDIVLTNVGNAYHPHLGAFIAPRSGLYVFTWTIRVSGHSYQTTELVVNNNVVNLLHFNPYNNIDGSVSSTAVAHVNLGDDVLIRTNTDYHSGNVVSNLSGRSSFAGWILI